MKTTLEQLHENIHESQLLSNDTKIIVSNFILNLLETEKEQIENAFNEGYEEMYQKEVNGEPQFYRNGRDFYIKTFKLNQKTWRI